MQLTFVETTEPGDCPHSYTIVRTWTATDWCGNETTLSQNITVIDDEAPVISGVPDDLTVECSQIPAPAQVTATDNCDGDVTIELTETQTDGCPFTITRTWTATDACGNASTATQTIYVYDDTPPVFVDDPADITVNCGEVPDPQDCIATDNCTDSVAVTFVELMEPMDDCTYQIKRLWEAEDECGNTAVVDQLITVIDSEAPVIEFTHPLLAGAQEGDEIVMLGTPFRLPRDLDGNIEAEKFARMWTATRSSWNATRWPSSVRPMPRLPTTAIPIRRSCSWRATW